MAPFVLLHSMVTHQQDKQFYEFILFSIAHSLIVKFSHQWPKVTSQLIIFPHMHSCNIRKAADLRPNVPILIAQR